MTDVLTVLEGPLGVASLLALTAMLLGISVATQVLLYPRLRYTDLNDLICKKSKENCMARRRGEQCPACLQTIPI